MGARVHQKERVGARWDLARRRPVVRPRCRDDEGTRAWRADELAVLRRDARLQRGALDTARLSVSDRYAAQPGTAQAVLGPMPARQLVFPALAPGLPVRAGGQHPSGGSATGWT